MSQGCKKILLGYEVYEEMLVWRGSNAVPEVSEQTPQVIQIPSSWRKTFLC